MRHPSPSQKAVSSAINRCRVNTGNSLSAQDFRKDPLGLELVAEEMAAREARHTGDLVQASGTVGGIHRPGEKAPEGRARVGRQTQDFAPSAFGADEARPHLVEEQRFPGIERTAAAGAFAGRGKES